MVPETRGWRKRNNRYHRQGRQGRTGGDNEREEESEGKAVATNPHSLVPKTTA
jgi:hypothetical protein